MRWPNHPNRARGADSRNVGAGSGSFEATSATSVTGGFSGSIIVGFPGAGRESPGKYRVRRDLSGRPAAARKGSGWSAFTDSWT